MGIFCIRNQWDYLSCIMDHPVAVSKIQVNCGTQILFYHRDFISVSLHHHVCDHIASAWEPLPVCTQAQWRLPGQSAAGLALDFRRRPVHHRLTHSVWRLPVQRTHGCAHPDVPVHQRILTPSLLVVPSRVLAAERRGHRLHLGGPRALHRGCRHRLLHYHKALLVVPLHGQWEELEGLITDQLFVSSLVVPHLLLFWEKRPRRYSLLLLLAALLASWLLQIVLQKIFPGAEDGWR